jgi:biotin carboxyl carrier protein
MNNVADKKSIQKLLKLIQKTDIEEICVSENDAVIRIKRLPQQAKVIKPSPAAELVIPDVFIAPKMYTPVKSKNIGVFQLAAKIEVGSSIKAGQVVGQVLAMGVKNDVTAEDAGKVAEILTEDGAVVDYGHAVLNLA